MGHHNRIALIDIARTVALAAMVVFHFTYDLETFGFAPRGTMASAGWVLFAKIIASSFIFLSGVSLVLGSLGGPIVARKYLKRLAMIGAAAIAVTLGTYFAMGNAYVRFGILHHMFVASILGLLFLRLPFWLNACAGALVFMLPSLITWPVLNSAHWLWLGQSKMQMPPMVDYIPLIPWFGMFLLGMGVAGLLARLNAWRRIGMLLNAESRIIRVLSWPGQHSLFVYLIHQPILFGTVALTRFLLG